MKIILDLLNLEKKKHNVKEESFIKRYEELIEERILWRQFISDQLRGVDHDINDFMPSGELKDKYFRIRRSDMMYIWGIIEKFTEEYKKRKVNEC
jgi:hypothetical protein